LASRDKRELFKAQGLKTDHAQWKRIVDQFGIPFE
jgi:hypothetical protein